MKVKCKISIQFMMKDRERDIPQMSALLHHSVDTAVDVPEELMKFIPVYIRNSETPGNPYNADKNTVAYWKKKVKKAYPDMFAKYTMPDGSTTQLKPSDDDIIDAAICMSIEDVINAQLETNIGEIMTSNNIVEPSDTETHYYADKFVHLVSWAVNEDSDPEPETV